ncbi:MAG: hypothetical protein E6K70_18505 [Planctomycetota bacterium]|nr:MAG: hypothetical protein E6K70_18505 [Planctomycetota bacterium]
MPAPRLSSGGPALGAGPEGVSRQRRRADRALLAGRMLPATCRDRTQECAEQ